MLLIRSVTKLFRKNHKSSYLISAGKFSTVESKFDSKYFTICPICGCFYTEASLNYINALVDIGLPVVMSLLISECKYCNPGSEHFSERIKLGMKE